jgi:hypothetical protein
MNAPVRPELVRKSKPVSLRKDLPLGFGNRHPNVARPVTGGQTKGYVTSNGFESGMVAVEFPLYDGTERVRFNLRSAENFLECDPCL